MTLQFSLKRLFAAVTLIALGMAAAVYAQRAPIPPFEVLRVASGGLIGGGLFTPFKRTPMGVLFGMTIGLYALAFAMLTEHP